MPKLDHYLLGMSELVTDREAEISVEKRVEGQVEQDIFWHSTMYLMIFHCLAAY